MPDVIFFGWGRNAKRQALSDQHVLLLHYQYLHVFWLFRITLPRGYSLATLGEHGWATRSLTAQEIAHGGYDGLTVHWWWRWGLLIGLACVALIGLASSLAGS
ncbi:hypothetical protein [Cellulomonas sp. URHB0016]